MPIYNKAYSKDDAAQQPPMGWNSWDCYAANVTEDQLLGNAEYVRDHLKQFGWQYIVCDIQWYEPLAGTGQGHYRPFADLTLDAYGRPLPAVNRFPSASGGAGFKPIADKIHDMGLLFGIHMIRGIPRQAVHARLPVKGTDVTADQIADCSSICKWNSDMYGVIADKAEAKTYYNSLFEQYAAWGVDYVKVDDICNTNMYPHNPYSARGEIELIHNAIRNCGRQMVLSLSPGPAVIDKAWHLSKYANMWRITDDFWDRWDLLLDMFSRCELWQTHVKSGCWPDCDMLPLGKIGMGFREGRYTRFTKPEQITMMTLWCIFRSPLMMGGELRENDDWTLALLTNDEVLAVNRFGHGAKQIMRDDKQAVWLSYGEEDELYLALFNLSDEASNIQQSMNELGYCDFTVRDLWKKQDLGTVSDIVAAEIEPHGAVLYRLTMLRLSSHSITHPASQQT